MPANQQVQSQDKAKVQAPKPVSQSLQETIPQVLPPLFVQRAGEGVALRPRLTPSDALHLQRLTNNRTVTQLLRRSAAEAMAGSDEPDQERPDEEPRVRAVQVSATLRKGSDTPEVHQGGYTPRQDEIVATKSGARQAVAPTGTPTVGAGGGNDCTPGNEALDWNVMEAGENWRANVVALRVSGDIHITAWPSDPAAMTTPNTPNPVDGGNINNTAGSLNNWEAVIADIADYDNTSGGGAGRYWHSTDASNAHEWAHWNQDYLNDALRAGNWAGTNTDIDALTVPKSAHADAAAARTALEPRVTTRFNTFVAAVTARWNVLINGLDKPGRGGRGYAAGMAVLNGIIGRIQSYRQSKSWTSSGERALSGAGRGALIGAGIGTLVGGPIGTVVGAGVGAIAGGIAGWLS
jgi:hypothetical protein